MRTSQASASCPNAKTRLDEPGNFSQGLNLVPVRHQRRQTKRQAEETLASSARSTWNAGRAGFQPSNRSAQDASVLWRILSVYRESASPRAGDRTDGHGAGRVQNHVCAFFSAATLQRTHPNGRIALDQRCGIRETSPVQQRLVPSRPVCALMSTQGACPLRNRYVVL